MRLTVISMTLVVFSVAATAQPLIRGSLAPALSETDNSSTVRLNAERCIAGNLLCSDASSVDINTTTKRDSSNWPQGKFARWALVLQPVEIDDSLGYWVNYVDPRPTKEFIRFSNERLEGWIKEHSQIYFDLIFLKPANPFAEGHRPIGYYLAGAKGETSLLLYDWQAKDYHFTAQESAYAILMRIRPLAGWGKGKNGWDASKLIQILEECFSEEITGKPRAADKFKITGVLRPGLKFTNSDKLGGMHIESWKKPVFVCLTDSSISVIVFKAKEGRHTADIHPGEAEWLCKGLVPFQR
jgi:hypothetical protein